MISFDTSHVKKRKVISLKKYERFWVRAIFKKKTGYRRTLQQFSM